MFPTDGGCLLASLAGEAAIRQGHAVQLGPCGASQSRHIDQRELGVPGRECGTDATLGRPGSSCKAIHVAEFGVGSERDDSTAWGHLAGSGVEPLPAIAAGPRGGRGQSERQIWVTTSLRVIAPAPHHWVYKRTGGGGLI